MADTDPTHAWLHELRSGGSHDEATAYAAMTRLLEGDMSEPQIGAWLALLATRDPSPDELVGAARAMRERVTPVPFEAATDEALIDTCGTGGAPKTFNVSTAAAIVAASVTPASDRPFRRIVVAKHGNRSRTGRGSAEVLGALGVNLDATPEQQAACLREVGICFCFAIHHHPAMRHAVGPRRALGFPTIFNMLGPLTNPAGASRQLIGVSQRRHVPIIADALAKLGTPHARIAHSHNGLDELSVTSPFDLAVVRGEQVSHETFDPQSLGLQPATIEAIRVDGVDASAELLREIFSGIPSPHADTVALATGAALLVADAADTMQQGLTLAREALESGAALHVLQELAAVSHREA